MYNHRQEKLDALRNAVLNAALRIDINENTQMVLLRYIDDLTPLHMKMLALFENPRGYLEKVSRVFANNVIGTTLDGLIEHAIPELHKQHENIRILFQGLSNYGLITTKPDSLQANLSMTSNGIYATRTSDMARVLLRYISEPRELANAG